MIYQASHRKDKEKGDPKVGGHPSACASYLHIASALHLSVRSGFDCMAVKPHAAPMDHTFHYMMDLLLEKDLSRFDKEKSKIAMMGLRKYSKNGEPVFQSYHSAYDADNHNFLPSGTVGIPPVQLGYLAHAYRLAKDNGFNVPEKAHFWAVMGDSEYREGSLQEALPDFAERELGNLTWIVDYNRQSLDGNRITNKEVMNGTDDRRIERTRKRFIEAPGIKWNDFLKRYDIEKIDLFKMNIEGAEKDILRLISDFSPIQRFIISCHDFRANHGDGEQYRSKDIVLKVLKDNGYKIKTFSYGISWSDDWIYAER